MTVREQRTAWLLLDLCTMWKTVLLALWFIVIIPIHEVFYFHQLGPLGRVGLVVEYSVCLFICVSPFHAIFFEACHWSSDHMTRSRSLIGQPSFPTIVPFPCDFFAWSDWCRACLVRGLVRSQSRSRIEP